MIEKKNIYNIILTFIITVGVIQILNLFIPVSLFKGFSVMVYSFSLLLILLSSGVGFSLYNNVNEYIYLLYYAVTNIIPIIIVLFTNIKYIDVIENDKIKLERYNTLITIFILFYLTHLYIYYKSFTSGTGIHNLFMGNACITVFNIFLSGLIWREISFYVTDG